MPVPSQPQPLCGERRVFRSKITAQGSTVKVRAQNRSCFTATPSGVSRTGSHKTCVWFSQRSLVYFWPSNQNIQGNVLLKANIWKSGLFLWFLAMGCLSKPPRSAANLWHGRGRPLGAVSTPVIHLSQSPLLVPCQVLWRLFKDVAYLSSIFKCQQSHWV